MALEQRLGQPDGGKQGLDGVLGRLMVSSWSWSERCFGWHDGATLAPEWPSIVNMIHVWGPYAIRLPKMLPETHVSGHTCVWKIPLALIKVPDPPSS